MTYNLSEALFENDFYELEISDGSTIVFNIVDEQMAVGAEELNINAINVAILTADGRYVDGINVIGEGDEYYTLQSEYKEYLGKPLTKDNIQYCTVEVSDD